MRLTTNAAGGIAAIALSLSGFLALGLTAPQPVSAAAPTAAPTREPYMPGRHVYDYGHLLSPKSLATAERLADGIEAAGGGRVVVYTADTHVLPDRSTLATEWGVDGLLLSGYDGWARATLGPTLKAKLPTVAANFLEDASSSLFTVESWVTSTLARTEALLKGTHVFDGAGALDASGLAQAETAATSLADEIGAPVYVDIAIGDSDDPADTAFFNASDYLDLGKSFVIALAVSGNEIGGYLAGRYDIWVLREASPPWNVDTLANETAPNGDVQAELLRAVTAVHKKLDPAEVADSVAAAVRGAITGFFDDRTNQTDSGLGAVAALFAVVVFVIARRRRRHEPGYADDDSVLLPAPPADMTPALAAFVAAPLDTTRAVTVALLDLAAHGYVAFYQEATPLGPRGGIKVMSAAGLSGHAHVAHAAAASRPLGPAEQFLLQGLQAASSSGANLSPTDFAELRPLFEQTGEQLERIAGQRGWLRIKTRSVSWLWVAAGVLLLIAAGIWAYLQQPVAAACEGLAGLIVLPRATRMPLPLRTPDGAITSAMADAYRRTLRHALAGAPGEVPPWLANAEEAALWGYAWGLEGEVQAFVGRSVDMAMLSPDALVGHAATLDAAKLRSFTLMLGGLSGTGPARPVGLDTDTIASTLNGLGRSISSEAAAPAESVGETRSSTDQGDPAR